MPKKICIIHPVDGTTDFLVDIYSNIKESLIEIRRIEKKEDHLSFFDYSPKENVIMFLGHGTSNSLKGASTSEFDGILMAEDQLSFFKEKNVILFSCRSNQYLKKFYKTANLKCWIGFPNMITDYDEIPYYDDSEIEGLTSEDIEYFKIFIVNVMRDSLMDFIDLNLNFLQLFNRISLYTNKSILQYFNEPNYSIPLGNLLLDFKKGLLLKSNFY